MGPGTLAIICGIGAFLTLIYAGFVAAGSVSNITDGFVFDDDFGNFVPRFKKHGGYMIKMMVVNIFLAIFLCGLVGALVWHLLNIYG